MADRSWIIVRRLDLPDSPPMKLIGRDGWACEELHLAGARGCTPLTTPGPRWSGYVLKLRKRGLNIETITEMHGGEFAGKHARYVLHTRIEIIDRSDNLERRSAA